MIAELQDGPVCFETRRMMCVRARLAGNGFRKLVCEATFKGGFSSRSHSLHITSPRGSASGPLSQADAIRRRKHVGRNCKNV